MIDIVLWIIVVFLYSVSILSMSYIIIIAISFFQEAPYVPIDKKLLKECIKYLEIETDDIFLDIGSGDGRVVRYVNNITGNRLRGYIGLEISNSLVIFSKLLNFIQNRKNQYYAIDIFKYDFKGNYKIFMYLTSNLSSLIFKKLVQELEKGSIIISVVFPYSEEILERYNIEIIDIEINKRIYKIYKYVI